MRNPCPFCGALYSIPISSAKVILTIVQSFGTCGSAFPLLSLFDGTLLNPHQYQLSIGILGMFLPSFLVLVAVELDAVEHDGPGSSRPAGSLI